MSPIDETGTFDRWLDHWPRLASVTDRHLLVLSIQLMAEDALHHRLGLRLGVDKGPLRGRATRFADLVAAALAGPQHQPLRDAFVYLNRARNGAAHELDSPKFDDHVREFVAACGCF